MDVVTATVTSAVCALLNVTVTPPGHHVYMTDQLVLIDVLTPDQPDSQSWQLDSTTCEIGRRGVARARRALQAARTPAEVATVDSSDFPAAA